MKASFLVIDWRNIDWPAVFVLGQGIAVSGFGLFCIVAILLGY
jgi:hypothetical protein